MTIDEAIKHNIDMAERYERFEESHDEKLKEECLKCAEEYRQLAEWLMKLEEAEDIIRTCNRMFGFLLECEIENTLTRYKVETLVKNITEYLSGGSENGT